MTAVRSAVSGIGLRVIAVDAVPLVREGLRMVIQQAPGLAWLGGTGNPQAVRGRLPVLRPNVVIVDSAVDPHGGLIRDLIAADSLLTVVAMFGDHYRTGEHLSAAQAAGAHGLLRRDAAPDLLLTAIRAAHASRRFIDPGLVAHLPPVLGRTVAGPEELLTARQCQVLGMIAEGLSERAIAERLVVSPDTVRTHIKQMRRRLGARDRAHAVARGYRLGVLSVPAVDPGRP